MASDSRYIIHTVIGERRLYWGGERWVPDIADAKRYAPDGSGFRGMTMIPQAYKKKRDCISITKEDVLNDDRRYAVPGCCAQISAE